MIHHVALELRERDAGAEVEFWALLGFAEVAPAAASLAARSRWVRSPGGAQIHLLFEDEPVIPIAGHVAVVAATFDETLAALRAAGHQAAEREPYWGERRAKVVSPAGHRVELIAAGAATSAPAPPPAPRRDR